jgi:hypothetical protein
MKKIILLLTVFVVLTGCFTDWQGEGTIVINLGSGSERSALRSEMPWPNNNPNNDIRNYISHEITITGNNYNFSDTFPPNSGTVRQSGIPAGTYTVTVTAILKGKETPLTPDKREINYATGKKDVEVKAGQTAQADITMTGEGFCKKCVFNEEPATFFTPASVTWECENSHEGSRIFGSPLPIKSPNDWGEAISQMSDNPSGTYTLYFANNAPINIAPVDASELPANLTLIGSNAVRTIKLASAGNLFTIDNGKRLTIKDIALVGIASNTAVLVRINDNGTFTMNGNSSVSDNISITATLASGVYLDNGGTFTMNDNSSVSGNIGTIISGNGAGVFVSFGSIFTMNNTSSVFGNKSPYNGGGVIVNGTFFMNDSASIHGNEATGDMGGGVLVGATTGSTSGGKFIMNGGAIYNNTAKNNGGGVSVSITNLPPTFTMNGGTIYDNTATNGIGASLYVAGLGIAKYGNDEDIGGPNVPRGIETTITGKKN